MKGKKRYWILLALLVGGGIATLALPWIGPERFQDLAARKQNYFDEGSRFFEEGRYQEALISWRNAIQLDPSFAEAQFGLATVYVRIGLRKMAIEHLNESVRLAPDMTQAHLELGRLYFLNRDLVGAYAKARIGVGIEPGNPDVWVLLGNVAASAGRFSEALAAIQRALELAPSHLAAYLTLGAIYVATADLDRAEETMLAAIASNPSAVTAHVALARLYERQEQWEQAESAYQAALEVAPEMGQVHALMAQNHAAQGQLDEAISSYRRALELDASLIDAKKRLAYLLLTQDRASEAMPLVDEVLAGDLDGLYLKGRLHIAEEEVEPALASLRQLFEREPDYKFGSYQNELSYYLGLVYGESGEFEKARELLERVREDDPDSPLLNLLIAAVAFRLGDAPSAVARAEDVLRVEPRSVTASLLLGRASLEAGNVQAAATSFRGVTLVTPDNPEGHFGLGLVHRIRKEEPEAIAAFERVLELDPDSVEAVAQLASIHHEAGRPDAALERCLAQLEISPDSSALHQLIGEVLLARGESEQAERYLTQAIELDPQRPGAHFYLGMLYDEQGDRDRARVSYERALRIAPEFGQAANNLAWLYAEHFGDLDRALSLAQTARRQLPDDAKVLETLGWIHYRRNDARRAITLLERSAESDPRNANAFYHLGIAYFTAGRLDDSERALNQALALGATDPGSPDEATLQQAIAEVLLARGERERAEKRLTQAIALEPDRSGPHFFLGVLYEERGDRERARASYEEALRISPQFGPAANNLAWLLAEHGGDLERALVLAETAREQLPDSARVMDTLGWVYYKRSELRRAIPMLQKSIDRDPRNPSAQFHLGMALYSDGQLEASERALTRALALGAPDPNASEAQQILTKLQESEERG